MVIDTEYMAKQVAECKAEEALLRKKSKADLRQIAEGNYRVADFKQADKQSLIWYILSARYNKKVMAGAGWQ